MNTVQIEGKEYTFPAAWNELNKKQLLKVARVLLMPISDMEKKLRLILYFLKLKGCILCYHERNYLLYGIYRYLKWLAIPGIRKGKIKMIGDEDLWYLSETVNFLFDEVTLTNQLIQEIRINGMRFLGPAPRFADISFIEFAKADARYHYYITSENEMYLNQMVAILYRPPVKFYHMKRWLRDQVTERQKYSDDCIKNADKLGTIPRNVKKAILLYWEGCYLHMVNTFPHVFTGDAGSDKGYGFAGMITELAGDKFGTTDQTAEQNLFTILLYLEMLATRKPETT